MNNMRYTVESSRFRCLSFLLFCLIMPLFGYSQDNENRIFNDSLMEVTQIGTNTELSDFGPNIVQDSLYFATFMKVPVFIGAKGEKINGFYKMYKAAVDKDGNTKGEAVIQEAITTQFNEGPVSWCKKTGELFMTANYADDSLRSRRFKHKVNTLRIVIAKQVDGHWKQLADFPYNNQAYSVAHPAVTQSGDTLVFSSEKPGGFGQSDLYYSVRKNGTWETPINLGPKVNTKGKEEFATFTNQHQNGSFLLFASDGRSGGYGGLDMYYTRFNSDFNVITHFETPINSANDDFAMTIPDDAEYGYLTSNRPGKGDDDIYKFTFKKIIPPKPIKIRHIFVYDRITMQTVSNVRIVDCKNKAYTTNEEGELAVIPCLNVPCEIKVSALGYVNYSKILKPSDGSSKIIMSDTIWMDIAVNKKIALNNIYFDYNKWDILYESAQELDRVVKLLEKNSEMKVILSAHTDDRGSDLYNLKLSQLRAVASVNYIISRGINPSRITGIGCGKTQLIHKSTLGHPLTPEQQRENRRTEIFIPDFARSETVKQRFGDFSGDHQIVASASVTTGSIAPVRNQVFIEEPEPNNSKEIILHAEPIPVTNRAKKVQVVPQTPVARVYVILGAFQERDKAMSFVKELNSEGIKAMICSDSGLIRVGVPYADYDEATKGKAIVIRKYKSAWIWTEAAKAQGKSRVYAEEN